MIVEAGGDAVGRRCDVGDPDAVRQAIADMESDFGGIDVLVNNAAWFPARLAEIRKGTGRSASP